MPWRLRDCFGPRWTCRCVHYGRTGVAAGRTDRKPNNQVEQEVLTYRLYLAPTWPGAAACRWRMNVHRLFRVNLHILAEIVQLDEGL